MLQHRVSKFKLRDMKKNGKRKILVFFLIDPEQRIISTKHVPIQQREIMKSYLNYALKENILDEILDIIVEYMPTFSIKEAKEFREKLMVIRGFIVDEKNQLYERTFSLCEH